MSMPIQLDRRLPHPLQPLPGGPGQGLALARARVHEFCGPARVVLAAMVMARSAGEVLWVFPGWLPERIFPDGLAELADPGRLIMVRTRRPEDILWTIEEGLRSGVVPLVVAELPQAPGLTPVRRMTLAAEAGAETAARHRGTAPLGLLLTPAEGGAQGVESRWHMDFAPSRQTLIEPQPTWTLSRRRAREHPPAAWHLIRDETGHLATHPISAS